MLMDIVWIDVIDARIHAEAMAFMYSEVVTRTARLRHNGVLHTPLVGSVGRRSASCVVLAMSHCRVLSIFKMEKCFFTSLLRYRSGDLILFVISLELFMSDPN